MAENTFVMFKILFGQLGSKDPSTQRSSVFCSAGYERESASLRRPASFDLEQLRFSSKPSFPNHCISGSLHGTMLLFCKSKSLESRIKVIKEREFMSTRQRIVSYETLTAAFSPYQEQSAGRLSGLESLQSRSGEVPPAIAISEISAGLQVLEKEKRNPDVMSGTEDRMASLIQTYAAQHATTVVPASSDGLEAKFDNHDLLGWSGSFF